MTTPRGESDARLSREEAIDRLAQRLYWNMDRLDPDPGFLEWDVLPDRERRFYRELVEDLVAFEALVSAAQND